jgi:4,5-DOPA dioxygenase extradiol
MTPLPSLFISHGAPTYALEPGLAGRQLQALGQTLPRPQAVLVVSPHWMTPEPEITGALRPQTIHDFGGFDPALYTLEYPAEGHPRLAARVAALLQEHGWAASVDPERGLDHGAWVPLMHLYPDHGIPVLQASMPARLDAAGAYQYGRALAALGHEGVLVIGSGSLTHNLYEFRMDHGAQAAYAQAFSDWIGQAVEAGDADRLIQALDIAPHAARSHPTPEHFWPLLIAAGAAPSLRPATVLDGGIVHGVLSMASYVLGAELSVSQDARQETVHA